MRFVLVRVVLRFKRDVCECSLALRSGSPNDRFSSKWEVSEGIQLEDLRPACQIIFSALGKAIVRTSWDCLEGGNYVRVGKESSQEDLWPGS